MLKPRLALVVPLMRILRGCWSLIDKHHIHEAYAKQIASARYVNSSQFLTGDRKLHEVATEERLNSTRLSLKIIISLIYQKIYQ